MLAGIDLAWVSTRNPTAIAVGRMSGRTLTLKKLLTDLYGVEGITSGLSATKQLHGVTIDGPTVVTNSTGRRLCENQLTREYGGRKAGCHATNLSRYPDSDGVALGDWLQSQGFSHLGDREGRWQLECYPHPALIEIFRLEERLLYKKGSVSQKRVGQARLAKMLLRLESSPVLALQVPEQFRVRFSPARIFELRGGALKHNEDVLDAIVCLYIAGLYQAGYRDKVFGEVSQGYIYVPQVDCTEGQDGS
ncbi:MAG: hypothetical protein CMD92_01500 [Gammaproteobacteria bacterium]|nr:hypothetical protein [Gammaproteobacteria bacterium]HBW82463.1 DUF429 domain-containing protein [Gammaproteobacteria bacterium]